MYVVSIEVPAESSEYSSAMLFLPAWIPCFPGLALCKESPVRRLGEQDSDGSRRACNVHEGGGGGTKNNKKKETPTATSRSESNLGWDRLTHKKKVCSSKHEVRRNGVGHNDDSAAPSEGSPSPLPCCSLDYLAKGQSGWPVHTSNSPLVLVDFGRRPPVLLL